MEGSRENLSGAASALADGLNAADTDLILRAVSFAEEAHRGQLRASGEPYITHPLAVASIVRHETRDPTTLAAAILHDVVEDTGASLEDVRRTFGATVARLVDGVTKIDLVGRDSRRPPEATQRLILATAGDLRVLIVKLSDRLHNMRTLQHLPAEKQRRIALETREVHVPLAGRIGARGIQDELSEHAFRTLEPEAREQIAAQLAEREGILAEARSSLMLHIPSSLRTDRVEDFELSVRTKSPHSIHEKMQQSGRRFEHVHDLLAMRIIVGTESECYMALGAVHRTHPPVIGRFADHIALPKSNLYQSLHTTILVGGELTAETQIRTREMHQRAEHGFAAHWRYKQKEGNAAGMHLREMAEDAVELMRMLRLELSDDETTVFTPLGEVVQLPAGATALDLAYRLHSEIGDHAVGAVADGRPIDLAAALPTGSTVRILVDPSRSPGVPGSWLAAVRTTRAARALRARHRAEAPGEPMSWERALVGSGIDDQLMHATLAAVAQAAGVADVAELERKVRSGEMAPDELSRLISESPGVPREG